MIAVFRGEILSDLAFQIAQFMKRWTNEMLRVPVYSGVLKLKNDNKKGLYRQAKIARRMLAHGKALSCCRCSVDILTSLYVARNLKIRIESLRTGE